MKTLAFIITFSAFNILFAQEIQLAPHIGFGVTSRIYQDNNNSGLAELRSQSDNMGMSFSAGLLANIILTEKWSIETGLSISARNYGIQINKYPIGDYMVPGNPQPNYIPNTNFKFIEIPTLLHYNINRESISFHIGMGVLSQILRGYDNNNYEQQNRPKYNMSPTISFGASKKLSEKSELRLTLLNFGQIFPNSDRYPHQVNNIHLVGTELRFGYYFTIR